jgi:hypothetical protein
VHSSDFSQEHTPFLPAVAINFLLAFIYQEADALPIVGHRGAGRAQ